MPRSPVVARVGPKRVLSPTARGVHASFLHLDSVDVLDVVPEPGGVVDLALEEDACHLHHHQRCI